MDNILLYLKTVSMSIVSITFQMAWIIFIVMIILETLKTFNVLDKINSTTFKFTKHLGITSKANFPLLVGLIIGISYGAGAIIASYKSGDLTKKDVVLVSIFLCICHAVVEDTLLFAKLGANVFVILFVRLILAVFITYISNIYITRKENLNER